MNWRLLAIGFCFLCGVLIAGVSLTGFAVAVPKEGSFIGFGLVVWSVLLLGMFKGNYESQIKSSKSFGDELSSSHGHEHPVIVLDTSAIVEYTPKEVESLLREHPAYIPGSVYEELTPEYRAVVKEYGHEISGYSAYTDQAKHILRMSEKAKLAEKVLPFVESKLEGRALRMSIHEINDAKNQMGHLIKLAHDDGFDISGDEREMLKKTLHYIKTHCLVSDTIIEVFSAVLYEAAHDRHVVLGEKDPEYREAVEFLKERHPQIGKYIRLVEPSK